MKRLISLLLLSCLFAPAYSQNTDLPGPTTNIQSLPNKSYIIAMDNTNQTGTNGFFNLKTYGLIVYLLNNNVKVKWVITAGKAKDAADFTVNTVLIKPTSNATNTSRTFRAGPFVIFAQDTTGVAALFDTYYALNSLAGSDRPNLYRTQGSVNVDIRYDLTGFKPKAAILNDGGNDTIHLNYMIKAGIPATNYTISTGKDLTVSCYTFASEPHNTTTGPNTDTAIMNIKRFVQAGGNFLAQCAAVSNYENSVYGRFQTTTGITVTNTNTGFGTVAYPNPDLSYSQFEGAFVVYDAQSVVQNWTINASGANNEHNHTTGTGAFTANISASVSKLKNGVGGLAFYMGVHTFNTMLNIQTVNGTRMYLNAFLTPSINVCLAPLPLSLLSFSGSIQSEKAHLQWTVGDNELGDHFELEKSLDGAKFVTVLQRAVTSKSGEEIYTYTDPNKLGEWAFYRLKLVNKDHFAEYSKIIVLKNDAESGNGKITVLENPVNSALTFSYYAAGLGIKTVSLYNSLGAKVLATQILAQSGNNSFSLSLENQIARGIYVLEIMDNVQRNTVKIMKQ